MSGPIVVVGAGMTGLSAARRLVRAGREVVVLEASDRPGGYVGTAADGEWIYEFGPNTLAAGPDTVALWNSLETGTRFVEASPQSSKRFVAQDGLPEPVPMSPPGLLKSGFFSAKGKWALAREPFRKPYSGDREETVADFVRRRLSDEWLQKAIGPFVSGVYAGDPEKLSLKSAFPKMAAMEAEYGSLIQAARKIPKGSGRKLYSTADGLGGLVDGLRGGLDVRLSRPVERLERSTSGWTVHAGGESIDASLVIVTVGADAAAALLRPHDQEAADRLQSVDMPPVRVVHHGYKRTDVSHPLDGFGVLVPRSEGFRMLGTLFPSTMFPGRAPDGHVLLTTYVGGVFDRGIVSEAPDAVVEQIAEEAARMFGISSAPVWTKTFLVERAITQYNLGHGQIVARLEMAEDSLAGLYLRGAYRDGIGLADRLAAGARVADGILERETAS